MGAPRLTHAFQWGELAEQSGIELSPEIQQALDDITRQGIANFRVVLEKLPEPTQQAVKTVLMKSDLDRCRLPSDVAPEDPYVLQGESRSGSRPAPAA